MSASRAFSVFLFTVLMFPILTVVAYVGQVAFPPASEWLPVLKLSLIQAGLSAIVSLILGIVGAIGLIGLNRTRRWIEILFLIPNLIPSLFVALSFLNLFRPFPFGIWGVVLIHAAINSGLVAVYLAHASQQNLQAVFEHAAVDGASFWTFWRWAGLRELRALAGQCFLFVFALCFTSFVIPLIAGGGQTFSFELLIYQHFRFDPTLNFTLGCALIQIIAFMVFSLFRFQSVSSSGLNVGTASKIKYFGKPVLILPVLILSLICFTGLFFGWSVAWHEFQSIAELKSELPLQFFTTMMLGLCVGFFSIVLLMAIVYFSPSARRDSILNAFYGPNVVLFGFALALVLKLPSFHFENRERVIIILAVAVTIASLPALFRLRWRSTLAQLTRQIQVAQTLGATRFEIARSITWPQSWPMACDLAALAAFWACGEFAICSFVLPGDASLSLVARGLMGAYRTELATAYVGLSVLLGLLLFTFFKGLRHVARS